MSMSVEYRNYCNEVVTLLLSLKFYCQYVTNWYTNKCFLVSLQDLDGALQFTLLCRSTLHLEIL